MLQSSPTDILVIRDRLILSIPDCHYLIDPGKPMQNGKVKRAQRTDKERFWSRVKFNTLEELREKQNQYLEWYNKKSPIWGFKD